MATSLIVGASLINFSQAVEPLLRLDHSVESGSRLNLLGYRRKGNYEEDLGSHLGSLCNCTTVWK